MSERLALRILIGLAIAQLGFWLAREVGVFFDRFGQVIALFFSAWLISFVLGPPADWLVKVGVRRPLAVLAVYVFTLALLVLGALLVVPIFSDQLNRLRGSVNAYTTQTPALLTWAEERAREAGVSDSDLRAFYRSTVDQLRVLTGQTLQNAIGWLTGAAAALVNIVFCLIISVYLMLDGRRIIAGVLTLAPARYRGEVRAVFQSINENFGGYIRGTLILAAIYAVGIVIVMGIAGLDYKAVSALFAGLFFLIPFVGPFVSLMPALLVALLTKPGDLWWIALLLIVAQQVTLNVVGPRVFGRTVNMHPLLVIGAALAGAALAGFWGALFGIPVVGIVASVVRRLYNIHVAGEAPPDGFPGGASEPTGSPDGEAGGATEPATVPERVSTRSRSS